MQKTKKDTLEAMSPEEMNGCTSASCSTGYATAIISVVLVLCTAANIGASWYMTQMSKSAAPLVTQGTDVKEIAETLRQIQYDQAGGKEVYDLYMKLQALQAPAQKAQLEAKIQQSEGGSVAPTAVAPTPVDQTASDEQYAMIMKDSYKE